MVRTCVFALVAGLFLASGTGRAQQALSSPDAALPADTVTGPTATPVTDPIPVASHVRIVRLSQIQGRAQLDRNTGRGFEAAFANIPITSGSRLRTESGTAEVEFEDGSTLRLAPVTEVSFTELGRTATGQTVTVAQLGHGMAYVSLARTAGARFALIADQSTLEVHPGSHVRFGFEQGSARLAVMDGAVDVQGPAGDTVISKKQSVSFEPVGTVPYQVASTIEPEPFDTWDKEAGKYQQHYSNAGFNGGSGMAFGSADLNYYGSFSDAGGCGSLWRPYFASAGWDPYGAGIWAWYPNAGYSWVSPYPWGWTPYHSGSWVNCPGAGWGWSPGAAWYGLGNQPRLLQRIASRNPGRLPEPPLPPHGGAPHYVASGLGQLQYSKLTEPGTFTFRSDSAGLGVPREAFGNLRHESASVAHHGMANTHAEIGAIGPMRTEQGEMRPGAMAMHAVPVLTRGGGGSAFAAEHAGYGSASASMGSNGSSHASGYAGSHSSSYAGSNASGYAGSGSFSSSSAGHGGGGGAPAGGGGGHR